jgi:signal transduction histidine kinase
MANDPSIDGLQKEVAYYKKQLDRLTGENLRNQYLSARFSRDIKEFGAGYKIIADIHRSFNFSTPPDKFYEQVLETVVTHFTIEKTLLFKYNSSQKALYPIAAKGDIKRRSNTYDSVSIPVPSWFHAKHPSLCVTTNSSLNEFEKIIQETIHDPFFIITPLYLNDDCWGVLYAGRKQEAKPMYLPFSQSDVYIFESLAGLISSLTRQLEQHEQLEKERNRIARDMHDDLGSGLTQIVLLSELMLQKKTGEEVTKDVETISSTARKLTETLGEIVWALNPESGTLEDLIIYLREQTQAYFEPLPITYSISFPEEVPAVNLDNQQLRNLFLVIKEALHNAVKYSEGDTISLTMAYNDSIVSFKVCDNGIGINSSKIRASANGLRNMQKRMSDIKGSCRISTSSTGSTIEFLMPVKVATTFITSANQS